MYNHPDFVDVLKILSDNNVILMKVTSLSLINSYEKEGCLSEALLKVFPNVQNLYIAQSNNFDDLSLDIYDYVLKISSNLQRLKLVCGGRRDRPNLHLQEKVTNILAAAKQYVKFSALNVIL